jgi:enoyl-CoA hydratase/carnithine racemase
VTAVAEHKIDVVRETRKGGVVAHVVFDNSRRLNVLNPPALADLIRTFEDISRDADVRVVVFSGVGGKAFIGGADIRHMATLKTPDEGRAFITQVHQLCQAIRDCPVPVIARLEGYTLGAGLEVAAACDIRIATESAAFGMPEVRVGIPSVIEAALLPRLIGWGRTSWLLLAAENIGARKAEDWGFVEHVVDPSEIGIAVDRCVESILAGTPKAIRAQKALIRRWEELPLDGAIQAGIDSFAQSVTTGEHTEKMTAFINRKRG